jgi:two-component system CheB/CheR fusion protein
MQKSELHPLVTIGASAGGLQAIRLLLQNLSPSTGASFIIIQHMLANHQSILPELLERETEMKVYKVEDGIKIEPNCIYVIPPDNFMGIVDSKLTLSPREKKAGGIHSIDHFLSDLAPIYQGKAIAVILSGTANDGTAGVRDIKSEGGICFAQDDTAAFQGMPHNAIDSGYIDFVLPPNQIAKELEAILMGMYKIELHPESIEKSEAELRKIHLLLLNRHGVDFSLYKQKTIVRRMIRRIAMNRLTSLDQYTKLLRENPQEADLLYKDLLINVTSFFRDPGLYTALAKKVFPALLKGRKANDPIRIWIPACATGEEPCSIAICLLEYLKDKALSTPIQIFATDLSETVISKARTGIYSKNILTQVSPQRLKRFFVKIDGSYQIIKPIRDMCIFATHNLLKDPPFSRMDMISCQNVLIYMEPGAQRRIMQSFHYALNPGKYLLLGKSETVGGATELFEQVDKDLRIYSKKSASVSPNFEFSVRFPSYFPGSDIKNENECLVAPAKEADIEREAEKLLFTHYMPASVLVNKDLQILRFYGPTFTYLQPSSGKASLHLMKMIRDELIFELRGLIKQVKKEGKAARKNQIQLNDNGDLRMISLEVHPVKSSQPEPFLLIVLQPSATPPQAKAPRRSAAARPDEKDRIIGTLGTELKEAREHARSMTEDFEATREELQSANEEILSSNEELQSINEELETSKEEMQSTNEELVTINDELQLRNKDLREAADFTKAIVETIREPLVVLSAELRILTANRTFYTIFRLNQDETEGMLLYEAAAGLFDIPPFRQLLKKISGNSTIFQEFTVRHEFGGLGMKVLQCKTMRLAGESGKKARILLALEDTTEHVLGEKALHDSEERFRHVSESGFINIMFFHSDGRIIDANDAFLELVGYTRKDLGSPSFRWDRITTVQGLTETRIQLDKVQHGGRIGPYEKEFLRRDGTRFWALVVGAKLENDLGIEFIIDITARKQMEIELRLAEEGLRTAQASLTIALQAAQMGVWDMNLRTGQIKRSPRHDQLLGYEREQPDWDIVKGQRYLAEQDKQRYADAYDGMGATGYVRFEGRVLHKNGASHWVNLYGRVFYDAEGRPERAAGVIFDITDRKSIEQQKDAFISIASHELKTPVTSIRAYADLLLDSIHENGDPQPLHLLNKLKGQADRLTNLVRDLLDVTKITDGSIRLKETEFDLNALIHSTAEEMQGTIKQHRLMLNLSEGKLMMKGDRERISQVLVNLLSNAAKYSPGKDRIFIFSSADQDSLKFSVEDFGIGMSSETASRVFERFYRAHDPVIMTFPGLGLGLFISAEIIKQHGGTIRVQGDPGKGSIFTVELPKPS